jgi:predicted amino acid dehydrogenase
MLMRQSRIKRAALVAGAAVVAFGAFTAAVGQETANRDAPTYLGTSEMTLGATATPTSPTTVAPVSAAEPADKAKVPCGFSSSC